MFTSRALTSEKDGEDLVILKEQVEELQRKLQEKDELLKSAENSREQINAFNAKLDELKHQALEKDSLMKYTQQQLTDAKVLIMFPSSIIWYNKLLKVRGRALAPW